MAYAHHTYQQSKWNKKIKAPVEMVVVVVVDYDDEDDDVDDEIESKECLLYFAISLISIYVNSCNSLSLSQPIFFYN